MSERLKVTGTMLQARGRYRRALEEIYGRITLAGLAPDDESILLRKIYVPLVLTPERVAEDVAEKKIHQNGQALEPWLEKLQDRADPENIPGPIRPGKLLSPRPFLLVEGEAGSGKTTLVHSITSSLSGEVRDGFNRQFGERTAIPILLRHVPKKLLGDLDALVDHWLDDLARREDHAFDPAAIRKFFERGDGLFLFDGLDELGTAENRRRFLKGLRGHRWFTTNSGNLAILTARPSGFQEVQKDLPNGLRAHVAPFSHEQIRSYLDRWFELRPTRVGEPSTAAGELFERLTSAAQKQRLLALARRPAYLAAIAFVHGTRGQLPHTRAELYSLLVDAYLEILDVKRGLAANWNRLDKLQVLSTVAFLAHDNATAKGAKRNADRRFTWTEKELVAAIREAIEALAGQLRDLEPGDVEELFKYYVARTGLLREAAEGEYQFGHLSFQEYLAALFLLDQANASETKAEAIREMLFSERLDRPGWQEVAMLLLATDATRSQGTGHRSILAKLDLRRRSHRELLTLVLSGEEITLSDAERRGWLTVWFAHSAVVAARSVLDEEFQVIKSSVIRILREESNFAPIREIWHQTIKTIERKKLGWADLSSILPENLTPSGNSRSILTRTTIWPHTIWKESLERLNESQERDMDIEEATALILPTYNLKETARPWSEEVHRLANRPISANFYLTEETSNPKPRALWWALEAWGWIADSPKLLETLAKRTPVEILFAVERLRIFAAIPNPKPISQAAQKDLALELIAYTMIARPETTFYHREKIRDQLSERRTAQWNWSQYSTLPIALKRAQTWNLDLALDRARAVARFHSTSPEVTQVMLPAIIHILGLSKADITRLKDLIYRLNVDRIRSSQRLTARVKDLLICTIGALTDLAALDPPKTLHRHDLQKLRNEFAEEHPELVELGITSVPLADAVLEDPDWETLELTTKAVLDALEARIAELEAEARGLETSPSSSPPAS